MIKDKLFSNLKYCKSSLKINKTVITNKQYKVQETRRIKSKETCLNFLLNIHTLFFLLVILIKILEAKDKIYSAFRYVLSFMDEQFLHPYQNKEQKFKPQRQC